MEVNTDILKSKLDQYFKNIITKDELGLWALNSYYDLLQGEYIYIEKLKVYHFLRTLSTFHIVPNDIKDEYPCSEEEVLNIYEILRGNKSTSYTFNLKISKKIYEQEEFNNKKSMLDKIQNYIVEYSSNKSLSQSKMSDIINYTKKGMFETNNLVEILETNIMGILDENIDFTDKIFDFVQSVGIYVGGRNINEQNFSSSVLKLFSCIEGTDSFRVCITYKYGVCSLTLVLV